jgi:modulator of drug activity B
MDSLPTFIVNDVIKAPNVPSYIEAYKTHLDQLFAASH